MTHYELICVVSDIRTTLLRKDYDQAIQLVFALLDKLTDINGSIRE